MSPDLKAVRNTLRLVAGWLWCMYRLQQFNEHQAFKAEHCLVPPDYPDDLGYSITTISEFIVVFMWLFVCAASDGGVVESEINFQSQMNDFHARNRNLMWAQNASDKPEENNKSLDEDRPVEPRVL